jgi:hypothetical protein
MKQRSRIKHILPLEERLAVELSNFERKLKSYRRPNEKSCYEKLGKTILGLT